eukprot:m.65760 g.65760  ORF g.65760 m.65760 type:complete len:751 (-) comp13557_c0_seq3:785-3037(-)
MPRERAQLEELPLLSHRRRPTTSNTDLRQQERHTRAAAVASLHRKSRLLSSESQLDPFEVSTREAAFLLEQLAGHGVVSNLIDESPDAALRPEDVLAKLDSIPQDFLVGMKYKLELYRAMMAFIEANGGRESIPLHKRKVTKPRFFSRFPSLLPFSRRIYMIEATFGSDIASYYKMMRWLIVSSFIFGLLIFATVVMPQAAVDQFKFEPQWYKGLVGEGPRNTSLLYYGGYKPKSLNGYFIPYAYFMIMLAYFMLQLALLVHALVPRIDVDQSLNPLPISSLFLSWDYKLRSKGDRATSDAAFLQRIHAALKKTMVQPTSTGLFLLRIFTFLLSLGVIGAIWLAIDRINRNYSNSEDATEALLPALSLAIVNAMVPTLFWRLARVVERYSSLSVLKISLLRSFLVRIVSLYVVLTSLFGLDLEDTTLEEEVCWETVLGQELYRVLLVDTAFAFVTALLYDVPRYLIFEHGKDMWCVFTAMNNNLGKPRFFLTSSILGGIYRQTLIWLGAFYAPLLPLFGGLLNVILVCIKGITMYQTQKASAEAFELANFKQTYIGLLILSLLLSLSPIVYSFANLTPSSTCGPFRNYADISSVVSAMISDAPKHVQTALSILGEPTVIVPLLFLLLVATYYFFRKNQLQTLQFAQAQRLAMDTHETFKMMTNLQRDSNHHRRQKRKQQQQPTKRQERKSRLVSQYDQVSLQEYQPSTDDSHGSASEVDDHDMKHRQWQTSSFDDDEDGDKHSRVGNHHL